MADLKPFMLVCGTCNIGMEPVFVMVHKDGTAVPIFPGRCANPKCGAPMLSAGSSIVVP